MKLRKHIPQNAVSLNIKGETKEEIITELIDLLASERVLKDRNAAIKDVMKREAKLSTGMQNGIALPHAKTNAVEDLVAAIGICKEGVDFSALDKKKSKIFILVLSPVGRSGPHIQFLAEISKILLNHEIRARILQANDTETVLKYFS
ncbi:MAG: PTS sugar transporter subunit IIA [Fibrobacterota bacterium]